jgi:hypothetical protein
MNLSYKQRMELIEIVTTAKQNLWDDIIKIDNKFKNDLNMLNDKKAYWIEQQDKAYTKKDLYDSILFELNDSI